MKALQYRMTSVQVSCINRNNHTDLLLPSYASIATASNSDSRSFLPLPQRQQTEDSAIRAAVNGDDPLDWPTISGEPLNEFRTEGLASMAFPALFPYAKGDPTCKARVHEVKLADGFKHLIRYGDNSPDSRLRWRFASHPRFPYWALNMRQRHQLLSQARIYLQHNPTDAHLTVEELRAMVGQFSAEHLMKRIQRYAAKLLGSNPYWFQRYLELRSLFEQKGPATFFWTVSSADHYWPDLHALMHTEHTTNQMRIQAVVTNPHIADWYFTNKMRDFVQTWLLKVLDAQWYWYRFEYQARGSTHAHGCAKLRNDPGLCDLVKLAAVGWLAEQQQVTLTNTTSDDYHHLQSQIDRGQKAKEEAITYADWIVTTMNDSNFEDRFQPPTPHPCSQRFSDIHEEDLDSDYSNLVNSVERHTNCSPAYCLRVSRGQHEAQCRFKFPREQQSETDIHFEQMSNDHIRATLLTKRNDPRVNSHNRLLIQNWRANVDIQIIVDADGCANYLAKYAAKGEPPSNTLKPVFTTCVERLNDTSDTASLFRRSMLRAAGQRDISAQETSHLLMSEPLYSCTFNFITLSLNGSHQVHALRDQSTTDEVVDPSLLDSYAERPQSSNSYPQIATMCLIQFARSFSIVNHQIRKRSNEVIVRTFPNLSCNPHGPLYGQYCKYQLIKYKPWRGDVSSIWNSAEETDQLMVETYEQFLQSNHDCIPAIIPHFTEELTRAEQYLSQDDSDQEVTPPERNQDEWMEMCRLNQRFATNTDQLDVDWTEDTNAMPPDILAECPTWISNKRQQVREGVTPFTPHRQQPVDVRSLNEEQLRAYNIVSSHYRSVLNGDNPEPLYMLVCGTAGSGKSFLISAIAQTLRDSCTLTGTTGKAACNICGSTLHSALQLPVQSHNNGDLQGSRLARLQHDFNGKHYLIVDEMSMLGQRTMAWVDNRLRQATGRLDKPLGGISVILIGDFGQLPPVGDRPLYSQDPHHPIAQHGYSIYKLFTTVIILHQMLRQSGTDASTEAFRQLLLRLRDGLTTKEDWKLLLQQSPQHIRSEDFTDAVHLYYDNISVAAINHTKLQSLSTPIARINAIHSCSTAATAKSDDAGALEPVLFLAKSAKVMLTRNLWSEVSLCNGSTGVVISLLFKSQQDPPNLPIAAIIRFPEYTGPIFNNTPFCVPIPPTTFEWQGRKKHLSRQQLPLKLCYAMTIHKSQGQTLTSAVIDIGKTERVAGLTFVALSRLKKLKNAIIQPMAYERLLAIGRSSQLQQRLQEEQRLTLLASATT